MNELNEDAKRQRFEQWEKLGLDAVKAALLDGGYRLIGGPPELRELAREWVRIKEAESRKAEAITLKPTIYGVGVDLKEITRRGKAFVTSKLRRDAKRRS